MSVITNVFSKRFDVAAVQTKSGATIRKVGTEFLGTNIGSLVSFFQHVNAAAADQFDTFFKTTVPAPSSLAILKLGSVFFCTTERFFVFVNLDGMLVVLNVLDGFWGLTDDATIPSLFRFAVDKVQSVSLLAGDGILVMVSVVIVEMIPYVISKGFDVATVQTKTGAAIPLTLR